MKILDKYITSSFLSTFFSVGIILFLIFILQGIWLFISEIAGKDLDLMFIVKFLIYYSPIVIPMVLPLSVLLASIMTFGTLSENYEFAAMKSSGISLARAMKPLIFLIVLISIASFFTANNIIPQSQYEFIKLRKNILQEKPSMAISAGQFSKVGDYYIKVDKKYGDFENLLDNVTIHKVSRTGSGAPLVIKSESGEFLSNENSNFLQLILYNGYYYEDVIPKNYNDRNRMPFAKSEFKKYVINFDLSPMNKMDVNDSEVLTHQMLKISELRYTIDSLEGIRNKEIQSFTDNIHQSLSVATTPIVKDTLNLKSKKSNSSQLLDLFEGYQKSVILEIAKTNINNMMYSIENNKFDQEFRNKNINSHWLSVHDKFVITYSCLLMFFIGAPLGAIIRKGGIGLPIVFAFSIFIIFHFINVFGKKVAQEDGIEPFAGAWMSSFVLTPLAFYLTSKATNDLGVMDMTNLFDPITQRFHQLWQKINPKKKEKNE